MNNLVSGRDLVVLVIEDDELQRAAYQLQLKGLGLPIRVVTCSNAFSALIKIGMVQPDVVITDLVMPDVDGFQLIRAIKRDPQIYCPRLIAVTALSKSEIAESGGLPDGVMVLQKPIPFELIGNLIQEMMVVRPAAGAHGGVSTLEAAFAL